MPTVSTVHRYTHHSLNKPPTWESSVTRDELLAVLLAERFGKTTPEWHNRNDGPLTQERYGEAA